jgi:protein-L-isoaspartate(D-aspartate) O-methyltransferase
LKDLVELRRNAIEDLRSQGILKETNIIKAMSKVPREEFLPAEMAEYAYVDSPLPIGFGQTTSALHMTALFCEYGEMKLGQHVLEVGGGCGYMSCVYAEIVAPTESPREKWGHVWSAEIISQLAELGRKNIERLGYSERVSFLEADASEGLPGEGPFDLIITTSAAPEISQGLIEQVRTGGTLLIPIGGANFFQQLIRVRKKQDGKVVRENLGGVAFVPMRGKGGWR